jgi:glycosyltransferase involved in cell wall biosynthesis
VPKLQGVPVILDLHDLMPEFFAARFGHGKGGLSGLVRLQERLACRFADHVITVTEGWRGLLIERGVPADRCSVVMNVADGSIFLPRREPVEPREGFHLLYHGSVTRRYGLDLAIRAVGLAKDRVPGIHLTIRGAGDDRPALLELRRTLGLEDLVDLLDEHVPERDLPAIIGEADAAVVPYRDDVFTDGILPTKLMEYAAVGIPCIAARTTAIRTYFGDANVEFFSPGDVEDLVDAIRRLADDPAHRAALAARSRAFTERYSWSRLAPEYVALIRRLGADGARSTRRR